MVVTAVGGWLDRAMSDVGFYCGAVEHFPRVRGDRNRLKLLYLTISSLDKRIFVGFTLLHHLFKIYFVVIAPRFPYFVTVYTCIIDIIDLEHIDSIVH